MSTIHVDSTFRTFIIECDLVLNHKPLISGQGLKTILFCSPWQVNTRSGQVKILKAVMLFSWQSLVLVRQERL